MLRKLSNSTVAASISSATVSPTKNAVATTPVIVTYTTVDPHGLYVGARVSITGLSSTDSNSPNVTRQLVYRLDGPNSFSVVLPTTTAYVTAPTISLTGGAGVYGVMSSINAALSAFNVKYSQPVVIDRPTFYNYVFPTLTTTATGRGITLNWEALGVANPAISSFKIERVTGTNTSVVLSNEAVGTYLDAEIATIGSATAFTYRVSASNKNTTNAASSSTVTLYIGNISTLTAIPTAGLENTIFVAWGVPATNTTISSYELYRSSNGVDWTSLVPESGPIPPSQTTYTDNTALDGVVYTYRVRAKSNQATGGDVFSNYATVSNVQSYYITTPASITATAAAGVANRVNVSWDAVTVFPATVTYELQEATSTDNVTYSAWSTVATAASTTSFSQTNALSAYYYKYRVRAKNTQLTSGYVEGTGARAYYLSDPLPAPTVTNAAATNSAITISASNIALPSITGYTIRRSSDAGANWSNIGATNYSITLPYTDSTTATNTAYVYSVKATNGQLTTGNWSATSASITSYSVPNAPTSLNTTGVATASTTVSLSWTPATVNASSPAVANYKLERSETSDFTGTTATVVTSGISSAATTYNDTVASTTTTYYYRLSAINSVGTGPASTSTYRIGVPTSLTATPVAATANRIDISWNAVTVTPSVTAYILEEATSADNITYGAWITATSTSGTSFSRTGATSGTYYKYRVRAFSAKYSAYSAESTATRAYYLNDPLPAPTVTNAAAAAGVYDLVISATNAAIPTITGYNIQRALSSSPTTFTSIGATNYSITLPYTDTTPAANTAYVYQVKATNGQLTTANWSPSSVSVTTYTVPNAPTSLSAVSGTTGSNVSISWTAATVAAGSPAVSNYKLERSETSNFTGTTAVVVTSAISSAATTYNDTGRSLSVTYYYRLSAINSIGTGPVSNTDSAVITLIPGSATITVPTNTTFNTNVTITATTNPNRTATLYRSTDNINFTTTGLSKTADASGNITGANAFTYAITTASTTVQYFRIVVAQNATYTQTTSASDSTTTVNNALSIAYDSASDNAAGTSSITFKVTDVNGTAVSGATVTFNYKRHATAITASWATQTTDASGLATQTYGAQTESIGFYGTASKANYNSSTQNNLHTLYVSESASANQSGYYSYAEQNAWKVRLSPGLDGYMYSGWFSTNQGRQASVAFFSGMPWAKINDATGISSLTCDITRKGGTGGSAMNISYGVTKSESATTAFTSLNDYQNVFFGATNAPAYTASVNNRDYGTNIGPLATYLVSPYNGRGIIFGHTTESATSGNYAVINNNITLYITFVANPYKG